jgi:hypothetical protein
VVERFLGTHGLQAAHFCHRVKDAFLKTFKYSREVASFNPELRCTLAEKSFIPQRVFPFTVYKVELSAIEHQVSSAPKQVRGHRDGEEEVLF